MSEFGGDFRVTLSFVGGDFVLVLPQGVLGEMLLDTPVAVLPRAPGWVQGLTSVRGDILPVLLLPHPWLPQAQLADPKLIVFRSGKEAFAVRSDTAVNFDQVRVRENLGPVSSASQMSRYFGQRVVVGSSEHRGVEFDVMRWGRELGKR